ncbi:MAG TPA: hypothetical protein VI542_19760 [Candidatus Tectomicrobia bacterium]
MKCFQLVKTVLDELYVRIPASSEAEKDSKIGAMLRKLEQNYAHLVYENNVDHSDLVSRFAYIYKYVTCHANLVSQTIAESDDLGTLFNREKVNVTCIGGGPGSDFLGILKYLLLNQKSPFLRCTLYDREGGWGDCWNDVDEKLDPQMRISTFCQPADVTDVASWSVNIKYLNSDLFTMIYFLSELDSKKSSAEPFFLNRLQQAQPGALLLYIDNNHSQFYNWYDELVTRFPIEILLSREGSMRINDYTEEKTDLAKYWDKFGFPKLTADVAIRVCKKLS